MTDVIRRDTTDGQVSVIIADQKDGFLLFDDLASFSKAVEEETGLVFDFESVVELNANFLEPSNQYLILNVKDYNGEDCNSLLFLTEDKAFLFSKNPPPPEASKTFEGVVARPFGRSTVLAFLTLSKVLESYKAWFEASISTFRELDQNFDYTKYRSLDLELERLNDRLEEFHDLLLKLEESGIKQVETQQISFDYSVLIAESQSLQRRCERRLAVLKDLARDHEMRATTDLNRRIERLNEVVKKLAALTVIIMIPTLVASHFGMNFAYMPELRVPWAYPAVLMFQAAVVTVSVIVFKRIGWL